MPDCFKPPGKIFHPNLACMIHSCHVCLINCRLLTLLILLEKIQLLNKIMTVGLCIWFLRQSGYCHSANKRPVSMATM